MKKDVSDDVPYVFAIEVENKNVVNISEIFKLNINGP